MCSFYLYGSRADAENGEAVGGSGFWLRVHLDQNKDWYQPYAVTNSHNIRKAGKNPVIRLNRNSKFEVLVTEASKWEHHPDGADVAVLPIDLKFETYSFWALPADKALLTKDIIAEHGIGIGDETFMVGRFINHEGRQRNTPSARFGNIAMMPDEPILDDNGILQESFLVECRSIPGYSGSPVFVWMAPHVGMRAYGQIAGFPPMSTASDWKAFGGIVGPWLLGINWCHLPDFEPIVQKDRKTRVASEAFAQSNTGMGGVIPAWKIAELLYSEKLIEWRKKADEEKTENKRKSRAVSD
jgi:hypothetical protein